MWDYLCGEEEPAGLRTGSPGGRRVPQGGSLLSPGRDLVPWRRALHPSAWVDGLLEPLLFLLVVFVLL